MFFPDSTETKHIGEELETKSFGARGVSFPQYLYGQGLDELAAAAAIALYKQAMPLFNAVDIRATALSMIPIRLFDKSKKEFVESHPVLDLLAQPNLDVSQIEFMYAISSFYDITGENFIVATGRTSAPPLELISVSPAFVGFGEHDDRFGLLNIPRSIKVQSAFGAEKSYLAEDDQRRLRFINRAGDQEIYHMKAFNPLKSAGNYHGLSKAEPLWLELQQYIAGNTTNLSMLKRGTRLSMAWINTSEKELTAVQWERMQQEAQKYSGDRNAGGTPVLDGMDVKAIQQTNRDMEFGKLQDAMLSRTSNTFDVPLALLLDGSMTMNNLETAILHLYDMAVLPQAIRIYDELSRFLLPRYKGTENMELRFNENEIPAIRARLIETARQQKDIGVNTTNEIRKLIGDESIEGEGDVVLVPSQLIPLSMIENPPEPVAPVAAPVDPAEAAKGNSFDDFANVLRKCVNDEGIRTYNEIDILALGIEKGLMNAD